MTFERFTVGETLSFEGLGLHSGQPVTVKVHPGEKGIGFRYQSTRYAATPNLVKDTRRCTKLGEISTIEHLMSAFAGLEISDAEVEVSFPELPALDGSAKPFAEALAANRRSLGTKEIPDLFTRVFLQEDAVKVAVSAGTGQWRYTFETGERWPGQQTFETLDVVSDYVAQIAPARTFGFSEEIPQLVEAGLARGLNFETALVVGENGYQNYSLFEDEPARHKMLDLIGDLYLSGIPIRHLNVIAERSGHTRNVQVASLLLNAIAG